MNTILFLMCSIAILNTPSYGQGTDDDDGEKDNKDDYYSTNGPIQISSADPTLNSNVVPKAANITEVSLLKSTESPLPISQSQSPSASDTTTPKVFTFKELRSAYMVAGGLILLCFFLLISTLLLSYKVCSLNRRIKHLSSDVDLVITTDYKGVKGKPKKEVEETTVLMSDLSQAKEEMGNGTIKEEGESKTEDGDKDKTEEAAESSSPSKGPEETSESPSAEATAASNSEGPGEPKDVL